MTANVLKATGVVVIDEAHEIERDSVRAVARAAFEEGQAAATEALEQEIAALREAVAKVVATATPDVAASSRLDAETITQLAADLAAWYLEGATEVDPGVLKEPVETALAEMADEPNLVLWVHPRVAEALGGEDIAGVAAVRSDSGLAVADFRLAADGAMIERRWSDAIERVGPAVAASLRANNV